MARKQEKVERKQIAYTPEETRRVVDAILSDTPRGFEIYYMLAYGRALPPHARLWINTAYAARAAEMGTVIYAFRGSTKTTTLTNAFLSYRQLLEPEKPNLLIQASDDASEDNARLASQLIEYGTVARLAFPQVQPDKPPRNTWGSGGYSFFRGDMPYAEWIALRHTWGKDPCLLGLGYNNTEIRGKHPAGILMVDDINTERNSVSHKERASVNSIVTGTIFPTVEPNFPWEVYVGTPYAEDDALATVEETGEYMVCRTPVLELTTKDVEGAVWFPEWQTWVLPAWPFFDIKKIRRAYRKSGVLKFAREYMLDLKAAAGKELKAEWLHEYPSDKIGQTWPVVLGVDYASTADKLKGQDRDYFAVAVMRQIPGGGMVLVDGYRDHLSQGEAEEKIKAIAAMYPGVLTGIGIDVGGKGEEYFNRLVMTTTLPVVPVPHKNIPKGKKFQDQMAPHFQMGRCWISDAPTEYLSLFKGEWVGWEAGAANDDTLDAAWSAMYAGMDNLNPDYFAPDDNPIPVALMEEANPFNADWSFYG